MCWGSGSFRQHPKSPGDLLMGMKPDDLEIGGGTGWRGSHSFQTRHPPATHPCQFGGTAGCSRFRPLHVGGKRHRNRRVGEPHPKRGAIEYLSMRPPTVLNASQGRQGARAHRVHVLRSRSTRTHQQKILSALLQKMSRSVCLLISYTLR